MFRISGVTCDGGGVPCATGMPGVCANGVTECQAGGSIICKQLVKPSKETCDNLDNDCNGQVDDGSNLCPTGQVCSKGVCVHPCDDSEFPCAVGLRCDGDGLCKDPRCIGVDCPSGQICAGGTCVGGCQGVVCPAGQDCQLGVCADPCAGVSCTSGVCEKGACVPSCQCRGGCPAPQACASNGHCVDAGCASATCAAGSVCRGGACVDPCDGALCPRGGACRDGACGPPPPDPTGTGGAAGTGGGGGAGGFVLPPPGTGGKAATGGTGGGIGPSGTSFCRATTSCTLVPQAGCPTNQACYLVPTGATCAPAGRAAPGATCASANDCAAGSTCITTSGVSSCASFCSLAGGTPACAATGTGGATCTAPPGTPPEPGTGICR